MNILILRIKLPIILAGIVQFRGRLKCNFLALADMFLNVFFIKAYMTHGEI